MHHDLKAHPDSFELMAMRKSNVQLRKNDRNFQTGDTCTFYEWSPEGGFYTGRATVPFKVEVTLDTHEGLTKGWCLLALNIPNANITRWVTDLAGRECLCEQSN